MWARQWAIWGEWAILSACRRSMLNAYALCSANDLRYLVVLAACLKTGYVPLFTSPRNSLDGQKSLVEKTDCTIFLTTVDTMPQVEAIKAAVSSLRIYEAPATRELLDPSLPMEHYSGRQDRNAKAHSLILHTSGSTGTHFIITSDFALHIVPVH